VRRDTGARLNVAQAEISPCPADAVLASMSICGLFPAVTLGDGHRYIDGGVRYNLPFQACEAKEYDDVYLLIAKPWPARYLRERGVIHNLIRNFNIAMTDQILDVTDSVAKLPNVKVFWPAVSDDGLSMLRFDHRLIEQSADYLARELIQRKQRAEDRA